MAIDDDDRGRNDTAAVLNFDILLYVMEFLDVGMRERNPSARVALARCARLCRASSTPALRLLWSVLPTPTPLLLLFTPDWMSLPCKRLDPDELLQDVLLYYELWKESDYWDRFIHYAPLVREVTFHSGPTNETEMNMVIFLAAILDQNGRQPVFPSLRSFAWKSTGETRYENAVVGLTFGRHSIGLKGILLCFQFLAPLLETYIDTSTVPHVPLLWILDELARCRNPHTIQISAPVAHCDIDAALTNLPLTHLRVSVLPGSASPAGPLSAVTLRVLDIHGPPADLAAMLPAWSLPSLERAKISIFDESRGNRDIYKPALPAALVTPLPPATLRSLHISLSGAASSRRAAPLPLAQFLRHAFQLHNLESFTFRVHDWYVKLSADDDAFTELADAWPSLKSLALDFPSWHPEGPVPTPLVLLALARSCHELQELVLPYVDHTVDLETLPPRGTVRTHPQLRRLCITDDPTRISKSNVTREVVEALAGFVGELFPHLSSFSDTRRHRKGRAPWKEVFLNLRRRCHK